MNPGFLELKTAQQLFAKLEEDFKRANDDPLNSHAWFNFFVTAEHLPEWHLGKVLAPNFRRNHSILRMCSHIANGGKHFELEDKRHKSIAATNITYVVVVPSSGGGTWSEIDHPQKEKAFCLQLSPEETKEFGTNEILVTDLAERILAFYRKELGIV